MGSVRDIVGISHVHGDAIVRVDTISGGTGAPQTHLLLDSKDKVQVVVAFFDALQTGEQDGTGDAVVQIGGKQFPAGDKGGGVKYSGVTHLHHGVGVGLILCAHINVKVFQLPLLGLHLALNRYDATNAVFEADRGTGQIMGRQTADLPKAEVSIFVNVGDDAANGIHVGSKHYAGAAPLFVADKAAQSVGGNLVHIGGSQLADGLGYLSLVS